MIYLHDMTTGLCIEADITALCVFVAVVSYPFVHEILYTTFHNLKEAIQFVYDNRYKWDISLETEIQLQKLYKEYT